MTNEEHSKLEQYLNKPAGVPVWRFYLSILIASALAWIAGFYHGKTAEEKKDQDLTIVSQEKVLETHTEVYSNMPRNRDDAIEWLYDHSR